MILEILLAITNVLCAQETMFEKNIALLNSLDVEEVANAASALGALGDKRAVPFLLQVLNSNADLRISKHVTQGNMRMWIGIDAKDSAVSALRIIGDASAIPLMEQLLRNPPTSFGVFTGNLAYALYYLTGNRYEYADFNGKRKLFEPSPIAEEEVRLRLRPDLKPVNGLTSSLEIKGTTPDGKNWLGSKSLTMVLMIRNHSESPIVLEVPRNKFVFSFVIASNERKNVAGGTLPGPTPNVSRESIPAKGSITRTWTIAKPAAFVPMRAFPTGQLSIKCIYSGGDQELVSNTVSEFYFPLE